MTSRVVEHVTIVGDGPEAEFWADILRHRGVTVERVGSTAGADTDLLVDIGDSADGSPPTVHLRGGPHHPLTRLLGSLVQAKREWEEAFDAVVDPAVILDENGTIVRGNLGLAALLATSIEDIPGHPYQRLFGAAVGGDPVAESLADGQARTREARYALLQGQHLVTTSPRRASGGLVVTLKDVTSLHEQERLLQQASRLADIGQLAAGVAHEINTPLASIALRAESLLRTAEDARLRAIDSFQTFPRYLKTIEEEVFRCKKIIGALLEFSRSRRPEVRETDLNALAETAAELVRHPMHLKQVELKLSLEPGLPTIRADDGQLRQVLLALLLNALDATPKGGHVQLETRTRDAAEGVIAFSVMDDGEGIPKEHMAKIFTPFFTTKAPGKGTGLGLAICHGIVQAHGGEIAVDSQTGRGTRVTVALPAAPPATGVA
jgi:two-component system, NtrC family, sensor kinase